jgi:hypothetical protein
MADDDGGEAYDDDGGESGEGGCGPCARGGGVLLLAVGGALVWMGADLVTGGALTRLVAGGLGVGAAVAAETVGETAAGPAEEGDDGGSDQA